MFLRLHIYVSGSISADLESSKLVTVFYLGYFTQLFQLDSEFSGSIARFPAESPCQSIRTLRQIIENISGRLDRRQFPFVVDAAVI